MGAIINSLLHAHGLWKIAFTTILIIGSSVIATPAINAEKIVTTSLPLIESSSKEVVSLTKLVRRVASKDVIIFGEFHDSQPIHETELELLKALYAQHGSNLVLSMEMFERDVQPAVTDFLKGRITEAEFMASSRPWPQYTTAYRPLVVYAKKNHIPVLASNIPRTIAASYAKAGTLEVVSDQERQYLPKVHLPGSEAYRVKFFATMEAMAHGGMNIPEERRQRMYMAQCLKDDTMAESMAQYKGNHPNAVLYHVQGAFHSEDRLGVAEKLQGLQPELRIVVINPVRYNPLKETTDTVVEKNKGTGDYLLLEKQVEEDVQKKISE